MTSGNRDDQRLNKNQRRDSAREKARVLRDQQKKKERRNRFLLQGGLIIAALAIVTIVTLTIVNSIRPPAPGPANMASDGIVIGEGFVAQQTPALAAGEDPVEAPRAEGGPIAIQVYLDYQCPFCAEFEAANSEQIATFLDNGVATIEYRPVAILDRLSSGTRYSTRSANAAACVANYSPDNYYDVNSLLFENQPEEQAEGLTDDRLIGLTGDAGVADAPRIADCIRDLEFENWVADATERASTDRALLDEDGQFGTPRVLVNGEVYDGPVDDAAAFARFVQAADSEAFAEENESPSPSPSSSEPPAESPAASPSPSASS